MIKAYKQLSYGVMHTRFTEKVWNMFPSHKHGWVKEQDLSKPIPDEIIEYMSVTSDIPDEIVELKPKEDDNKTSENRKPKRSKSTAMGINEGDGAGKKLSGRKKR